MICETGEYNFYGNIITEEGIYDTIIPTINGCDSLLTLNLTIGEFYRTYINATICEGDTYIENCFNLNYTGIDTITYIATNGCDSLVILNLDVNSVYSSEIFDTVSVGTPYLNNGFEIYSTNNSGDYIYSNELKSIYGCDSIINLNLNIYLIPEDTTQNNNSEFVFLLYPNPASDEVIIKAEGSIDMSLEFVIYDLFGKFISRGEIINDETFI